jgi:hypothetical protein
MTRPVRLVTTATVIATVQRAAGEYYDPALGYAVAPTSEGVKPVAEIALPARTASKTKQHPGDDDPDPDLAACY